MTFRHLAVAVAVLVLTPITAYAQWYSRCDICADRLGGRSVAGPYPNFGTCDAYRSQMRAQGFPFEPCYSGGAGDSGTGGSGGMNLTKGQSMAVTAAAAAAAFAALGWAYADDPVEQRENVIAGAAVGVVWGAALAYTVRTPEQSLPVRVLNHSIIFGTMGAMANVGLHATDKVNQNTYAMQGAAAGAALGTVIAFVVNKRMNSGFLGGDVSGRGWRRNLRLFTAPILQPGAPGWATSVQVRW